MGISVVTPSYNGADFLEATITSVVGQVYDGLEYVVVDGGSNDGSRAIIEKHAAHLAWWVSEPDGGQYDAINKGFAKTRGEVMGWLNSDDLYYPWTLSVVAEVFARFPKIEWLTTLYPLGLDVSGRVVRCSRRGPLSRREFFKGDNLPGLGWRATGWIQQESTFWRRSLWERAGGRLDATIGDAADFDLWARFFKLAELYTVETPLAGFRHHDGQKTAGGATAYKRDALNILIGHGGRPRTRLGAALSHAFRGVCPERLRPMAQSLGILSLGSSCVFDADARTWRIEKR